MRRDTERARIVLWPSSRSPRTGNTPPEDLLDTPAHLAAVRPFIAGDDSYLYARCAVVAAGRATYEAVLRDPARFEDFADHDAELLTVAEEAYERATGEPWAYETAADYEMGGNADAWGARPATVHEEGPPPGEMPPPLPAELWERVLRQNGLKPSAIVSYYRHNPGAAGAEYWLGTVGLSPADLRPDETAADS